MVRKLEPLCDKIGRERVEAVVHDFYRRLRAHPQLGPYFNTIADKTAHEAKIIEYWWIAMGGRSEAPPTIDMIGRHRPQAITEPLLDAWLALFHDTCRDHLSPELADQWHQMAVGIGERLRTTVVG